MQIVPYTWYISPDHLISRFEALLSEYDFSPRFPFTSIHVIMVAMGLLRPLDIFLWDLMGFTNFHQSTFEIEAFFGTFQANMRSRSCSVFLFLFPCRYLSI